MLRCAIDPGTTESAFIMLNEKYEIVQKGMKNNEEMLKFLQDSTFDCLDIEAVASYGMIVGASIFTTCIWIGRFVQVCAGRGIPFALCYRKDIKLALCGTCRAKDKNIRQALIDRFPATGGGKRPQIGTTEKPGPLFGVSSHIWAALAVSVYAADLAKEK